MDNSDILCYNRITKNMRREKYEMRFFEIELLSPPTILFAYSVEISKYSHRFRKIKNFFEICIHETGTGECRYADGTVQTETPGMINVISYLDDVECVSTGSDTNRHTTFDFNVNA